MIGIIRSILILVIWPHIQPSLWLSLSDRKEYKRIVIYYTFNLLLLGWIGTELVVKSFNTIGIILTLNDYIYLTLNDYIYLTVIYIIPIGEWVIFNN